MTGGRVSMGTAHSQPRNPWSQGGRRNWGWLANTKAGMCHSLPSLPKSSFARLQNAGHKSLVQFRIRLVQSEEGWAVSCPSLPGCHSQGSTREEAVENIKAAIAEWLKVEAQESGVSKVEEDLVAL